MGIFKIIIILVIFLVLSFVLVVSVSLCLITDKPRKFVKIDDYSFNVGDIVVWGNPAFRGSCLSASTISCWTHPGIVCTGSNFNDTYIAELTPTGTRKISLSEWIDEAYGCRFGVVPYLGPNPFPEQEIKDAIDYLDDSVSYNPVGADWIKYIGPKTYSDVTTGKIVCSEYIMLLLQMIGVQPKVWDPMSFSPGDIAAVRFPTTEGYSYGECIGFK